MTPQDNAYAAFMLDHAAGRLAPAESLVADLHRALSPSGRSYAGMLDSAGGALLESVEPEFIGVGPMDPGGQEAPAAIVPRSRLAPYLEDDLLALRWRKDLVGVPTFRTAIPMARLLRLDPGERAPGHSHGRRDVTVVLQGAFADEEGVYQKGDLAFAMPGLRHQPRAVGVEPCVCMVATERGRPIRGLLGLFGIGVGKLEERR
ncbi:MAG: cupin domain-containing protein [Hyphomonadaceae bacterium]